MTRGRRLALGTIPSVTATDVMMRAMSSSPWKGGMGNCMYDIYREECCWKQCLACGRACVRACVRTYFAKGQPQERERAH